MARRSHIGEKGREVWSKSERRLLARLNRPEKVQAFLDALPYNTGPDSLSPRRVIRERWAHCFGGALFAAAALRFYGHGAKVIDLMAVRDDDHVIAIFKQHDCWGAVAKSNFSGLRFREPVYRSVRELVMSYFDFYFNTKKEKTLRAYGGPIDLARLDRLEWMTTEDDAQDLLLPTFHRAKRKKVVTPAMVRTLRKVDSRTYRAATVGTDPKGLYRA